MQRASLLLLSALCLLFLLIHLLHPDVSFDVPSLILLFLAILPWLASLFQEMDIPGIGKFVFRDKKKTRPSSKKKPRRKKRRRKNIQIIVDDQ